MRKRRQIIAMGILFVVLPFSSWAMELERVEIRVPQQISQELQRFNIRRSLHWVGVNRVLYWSQTDRGSEAMIFDINTGEILEKFDRAPYRVDRLNSLFWFRSIEGAFSFLPYHRDPDDIDPPNPVNLEYVRRGAMRGQSTIQIRQIQPNGSVIEGEWYNDRETMRGLGFIGELGPGDILDMLPDGRTVLLKTQFTYVATVDNLRIVNLSRIEAKTDAVLNRMGSFFVDGCRILSITTNLERGPLGGIDGPGVVYPVLLDFEGNVVAEFRAIEIPALGIDYDPVLRRIVILELTGDRYASTKVAVYRLVE